MSLRDTLLRRARTKRRCADNLDDRADEYARCKLDVVYWINQWGWTHDPRRIDEVPGGLLPFDLFERQEELLEWAQTCMERRQNGLVEKSRDVGATWVLTALLVHRWLFRHGFTAGIGSRKEDLVDRLGDPKSIFEKARALIRHLPSWMTPQGYEEKKHATHLKIVNPANGSTIIGEAGDNIGRGGRTTVYLVDEFAFVPRADKAEAALSQNTDTIIYLSTPNGVGNRFYELRHSGNIPVFTFRWDQDPRKVVYESHDGLGFLENFERNYGPTKLAQEILIDYAASVDGVVIPGKWVRAAIAIDLEPGKLHTAGLDVADGGQDKNVLARRLGPVLQPLESWRGEAHEAGTRAHSLCATHGVQRLHYDRDGVGSSVAGVMEQFNPRYTHVGIRNGERPSESVYSDDPELPAHERFLNRRAELWWSLRLRFWKTWRVVEHGDDYGPEELISIPDDPTLVSQLSQPQFDVNESSLIRIESKDKMKKRGQSSPDHADAVVYCYAPTQHDGEWLDAFV